MTINSENEMTEEEAEEIIEEAKMSKEETYEYFWEISHPVATREAISKLLESTNIKPGIDWDTAICFLNPFTGKIEYPVWQFCEDFDIDAFHQCIINLDTDEKASHMLFFHREYDQLDGKSPKEILIDPEEDNEKAIRLAYTIWTMGPY